MSIEHRRRDDAAPDIDDRGRCRRRADWLPGCVARAARITSSSVRRANEIEFGSASIRRPPLRLAAAARARFSMRGEHPVGRHRQIVEAQPDGIGDGIGERRQERRERALARLLGAERPVRIVALDDADLDRRRILDGRHAVVEHVGGEQQAVVVAGLLAHRLAHAHPHRALHLALDREAVERLAAIVRHPDLVDGDHAGLLVDAHLDHLRRVAVAHGAADRGAAIFLAAVRFRNGRIGAGDGDGAAVLERLGRRPRRR